VNTKAIDAAGFELHIAHGWATLTRGGNAFTIEWSALGGSVPDFLGCIESAVEVGFIMNSMAKAEDMHILDYMRQVGMTRHYKQCRDAYVGMLRLGVTEAEWESFS